MSEADGILAFTATTAGGDVVEFRLPLHPQTASVDQVGGILEGLLDAITALIERHPGVTDGDVLQAMTLAIGVRMGVAGFSESLAAQLLQELGDGAIAGAGSAALGPEATRRH